MVRERLFGDLFLCIGAPHAGTGWLRRALNGHPKLHVSPVGRVDYFYHRHVDPGHLTARRRQDRRYRVRTRCGRGRDTGTDQRTQDWLGAYLANPVDDDWYRQLWTVPDGGYACDFSDTGAELEAAHWRRIDAECQTLRVLYVMRDPLTRLWRHGLSDMPEGAAHEDRAGFAAFYRDDAIRRAGDYSRTLAALQDGLRIGSWRVVFYEDLIESPPDTLRVIDRFLGLAPTPERALPETLPEVPELPPPGHVPPAVARGLARIRRRIEAAGFSPPDSWHF